MSDQRSKHNTFVFVDSELDERTRRFVLGHKLGTTSTTGGSGAVYAAGSRAAGNRSQSVRGNLDAPFSLPILSKLTTRKAGSGTACGSCAFSHQTSAGGLYIGRSHTNCRGLGVFDHHPVALGIDSFRLLKSS